MLPWFWYYVLSFCGLATVTLQYCTRLGLPYKYKGNGSRSQNSGVVFDPVIVGVDGRDKGTHSCDNTYRQRVSPILTHERRSLLVAPSAHTSLCTQSFYASHVWCHGDACSHSPPRRCCRPEPWLGKGQLLRVALSVSL